MFRRREFTQHHEPARPRKRTAPRGWLMVLGSVMMLVPLPGTAQSDTDQPREEVVIRADRATMDREAGTGVYSGNAEMVQGRRRLTADRIKLRLENGELREAEAHGEPVRIREGDQLHGHARRIVYRVADNEVHLYDDAFISHQGRTFEGARLHYELESRRVRASGSDSERIRMVIPQQNDSGEAGDKDQP